MKTIFLDMDGVVADFCGALHKHYGTTEYKTSFEDTFSITQKQLWDYINVGDFFDTLDKFPWADDLVGRCEDLVGDQGICFLSAPTKDGGVCRGKLRWIDRYFPKYSRQVLFGQCKHFCARHDALLIDDMEKNCDPFMIHGGHAVLFPGPFNGRKEFFHDPLPTTLKMIDIGFMALENNNEVMARRPVG